MTYTSTEQELELYEQWRERYALMYEPNYDEHLEADCKAAFLAGMQVARRLQVVPDEVEKLRDELAEETEAAENWRKLALQFDNHRMHAIWHLKHVLHPRGGQDERDHAEEFLKAPPLDGEAVLAERIAALAAAPKPPAAAPVVLPEPSAWMLGYQTAVGDVGWKLSFSQSGAGICQRLKGEEYEKRLYTEQQVRALLAEVSTPAQEGWCDGCSPDNCCGCGIAADYSSPHSIKVVQPLQENNHE